MPSIHFVIPHKLPPEEALGRIKNLLQEAQKEFKGTVTEIEEEWNDNEGAFRFKAMGFRVEGTLVVRSGEVELKGKLPLAALPFKGIIEKTIREQAEALFL